MFSQVSGRRSLSRVTLATLAVATGGLVLPGSVRGASYLELFGTFDGVGTLSATMTGISPSNDNLQWTIGTYSHSGGAGPSGFTIPGGGIDPTLSLVAGTSVLASNDNLSPTNHDAELHTANVTGRTGAAILPAMDWVSGGTIKLSPVSAGALGNGNFSLVTSVPGNGFQYLTQLDTPAAAHLSSIRANATFLETQAGSPISLSGDVQLSGGSGIYVNDADFTAHNAYLSTSNIEVGGSGTLHLAMLQMGESTGDRTHIRINGSGGIDAGQMYLAAGYPDSAVTVDQNSGTVHAVGLFIDRDNSGAASTSVYNLNGGTLSVNSIWIADGILRIAGGKLELQDAYSVETGGIGNNIFWDAGTIQVDAASAVPLGLQSLLGATVTLPAEKALTLNAPGLSSFVNLTGGKLTLASLADGGLHMNWQSGELALTSASAVTQIAVGKALGDQLTLHNAMTLRTAGAVNVASGSRLIVEDGGRANLGGLTNTGEVRLTGTGEASLEIASPSIFTNNGTLTGTGRVVGTVNNQNSGVITIGETDAMRLEGNLSNNGQVRLTGGQLTVVGSLVNNATGKVTGRGVFAVNNFDNRGTLTLSAGVSDVDVSLLSNRSGAKTIVTGAANATFYGSVINDAGSEFRISADSRATFLGPVTNLAAFTGTGVKIFESTATGGTLAALDGSSVVEAGASLTATGVRERDLTVYGQATLADNSPVSRLQSLTLDGGALDLRNNALVLDYDAAATSPLATIRTAIGSSAIYSSSLTANRTLLALDANALGSTSVGGVSFDASSIVIAVRLRGDADLNGSVGFADLLSLARNYGATSRTWPQGDFTGDGAVQFSDLLALARNYGQSLAAADVASFAPDAARFQSDFALAVALAPEPASITAIAALGLGVAGVRRRRL